MNIAFVLPTITTLEAYLRADTMKDSISRRDCLKAAVTGAATLGTLSLTGKISAQSSRGIRGQQAPELSVSHWIDGDGKKIKPFSVAAHRGKWVYLKCFQQWCPACHSVGFPNLQKLVEAFPKNDKVVAAVIQTTFEGHSFNTVDALRKNQLRYELSLPFGHDPGNLELPTSNPDRYPSTMRSYRTGGTPWVTLINPEGIVVFDDFHIHIENLIEHLKKETA